MLFVNIELMLVVVLPCVASFSAQPPVFNGSSLLAKKTCTSSITSGIDCSNDDLPNGAHHGVSDAAQCCSLCASTHGCNAWTVYADQKTCYLKSGCTHPISRNSVSGTPPSPPTPSGQWVQAQTTGTPHGRDEAGSYLWKGGVCLFGGRHTQSIDCYDAASRVWKRS